ncbi:MAG: type IX secretion system sortase PorU [Vicingaceae bacterium]
MRLPILLIIISIFPLMLISRDITVKHSLYWQKVNEIIVEGKAQLTYYQCKDCGINSEKAALPEYIHSFTLANNEYIKDIRFTMIRKSAITAYDYSFKELNYLETGQPAVSANEGTSRGSKMGMISFIPVVRNGSGAEQIDYFELTIETATRRSFANKSLPSNTTNSALSSGTWYKLGVDHDGLYKLSYKFLKDKGVDVDNIDPRTIGIYGNGGGMLPRRNSDSRPDDLLENAIEVKGESDGSFDKSDYILFYAQGPHKWEYDQGGGIFRHQVHQFSDTSYYFLTVDAGSKRIPTVTSSATPAVVVSEFDDFKYHEVDQENLINSGDDWLGEVFDIQTTFNFAFSFPNVVKSNTGHVAAQVVSACKVNSTWTISLPGKSLSIPTLAASGGYAQQFANSGFDETDFTPQSDVINVTVTYNKPPSVSSARGWLDYLELNVRRRLAITGTQLQFRDQVSLGSGFARFEINGARQGTRVWEVGSASNAIEHKGTLSGSKFSFVANTDELRTFVAVNDYDSSFYWRGQTGNQNLHADMDYDYIIVSHPRFLQAAERLSVIHQNLGLDVKVVTPQKIYNEFSSGAQDIVAIRDYLRMMYNRSLQSSVKAPKYLLFMGDGSVDNKYRISGNTNYIPTFQSNESYNPVGSYVSDDFYCMLDSNEGTWVANNELMDISVGRMPVQSLDQANTSVNKIERYLSSPALRDWRNTVCFIADDEDGKLHMSQANALADTVEKIDPTYDIEKIFIDGYKQYSTPGGARYPDAREAIKRQVERGALIVNYTGHGGEVGWAHERILTMEEVNNWTNRYSMPLFVTATCEFSRWDDPGRTSAGEVVFLNPDGGGIGLLTTVRLVYASANFSLSQVFYSNIFKKINGEWPRMGDVYLQVKNEYRNTNTRNFTLLGDPALHLAYPYYQVVTTSINGAPVSNVDTIGALGLVEVTGFVADLNGNKLNNFNGILFPSVFDKRYQVQTLNNDGQGPYNFDVQNKRLFKGKASVQSGDFNFKFVVPKDIAYNFGTGKISYYGENQVIDAHGFSDEFIVGGTDPNAAEDNTGPEIELFMNDYNFVYGGITDENPLFLAKVYDEHGINMAGTGIGHNISVVIDGKTDEAIDLNDYYSAAINSFQEGEVQYPFENLEAGPHKLNFKVWDVYNNSSEAELEFTVQEYKDITLNRVLNYPNPFTTNTSFWFEHNQPNTVLDVKIQVFTVSGKVVKTIDKVVQTEGFSQNQQDPISWDGLDEYGDKLGRGVYIYKLQVRSRRNNTKAEKIEKLVIL